MKILSVAALCLLLLQDAGFRPIQRSEQAYGGKHPTGAASSTTSHYRDSEALIPRPAPNCDEQNPCIVQIGKMPDRNWFDYVLFGTSLLLAFVGIAGILIGIFTLRKIERQTAATEKQIDIQHETLRPRLTISNFLTNAYQQAALGQSVCIDIKIANSGGIPAYGVTAETWIEFIERGSMERPFHFSSKAKYNKCAPINVDTGNPQGFEIPFNRCLSNAEIIQMTKAKGAVCFRIRLTYLVFDKERHFDHAYAMAPNGAQSIAEYTSAN